MTDNEAGDQLFPTKEFPGLTLTQRQFLVAFAACGVVTRAAEAAECGRMTHYYALRDSEEYARAFELAKEYALDVLEAEAHRRAVEGTTEDIYFKGEVCGRKKIYSDTLLIFLMKAANPEKYADRQKTEITTTEPIQVYLPENDR